MAFFSTGSCLAGYHHAHCSNCANDKEDLCAVLGAHVELQNVAFNNPVATQILDAIIPPYQHGGGGWQDCKMFLPKNKAGAGERVLARTPPKINPEIVCDAYEYGIFLGTKPRNVTAAILAVLEEDGEKGVRRLRQNWGMLLEREIEQKNTKSRCKCGQSAAAEEGGLR